MIILGIETSCDETSAAVVKDGRVVLSNVISSQIELHRQTGGVVPEVAAREHIVHILPVIDQALNEAHVTFDQIDAIAVTERPGLMAALLIGTTMASTLTLMSGKSLIPVNHIEGHIYSNWLGVEEEIHFPIVVLTVSGGHNELVLMRDHGDFVSLGSTRDDAAGEAFDKIARLLGLPYPGGPEISRLAQLGDSTRYELPRAMLNEGCDFSFSGLKSAVLRLTEQEGDRLSKTDLAASFQEAVVDVLSHKFMAAASAHEVHEIHLAGGVSANQRLRSIIQERMVQLGREVVFRFPQQLSYCTDNAAMIAAAGYFCFQKNPQVYREWKNVEPSTKFGF